MNNRESKIQQACVKWFKWQYRQLEYLLFAVPNGGARSRVTGAILKAEGVLRGVSDLILLYPAQGYHALLIELKTEKGRQSDTQKAFQKAT
ncbi:MAG: VRR-NUC domain-containing protein, partial [Gallicola sp.]|nr:VRR-NUC domain-containing protein [Gallicola sp.]